MRHAMTLVGLCALLHAATASAQPIRDHLQCYSVTNGTHRGLRGTVDLDALAIGLAPGCKLGRAKLYCAPATATVQPGTLFDGGMPIAELAYAGRQAEARICYKVTCPTGVGTDAMETATDRFGTHELRNLRTNLVCTPAGSSLAPPSNGFQITLPEIDIDPGQEVTSCYHFRTPNTGTLAVSRLASEMNDVAQQVMVFTAATAEGFPVDVLPAGKISATNCDVAMNSPSTTRIRWLYEAHTPTAEMRFPSDDGNGHPVALPLSPLASGYLRVRFHNTSGSVQKGRVTLNVEGLPEGTPFTPTSSFTSFDGEIAIPPQFVGHLESTSCALPAGAQVWWLTTHTHRYGRATYLSDDSTLLLANLDWAHPASLARSAPPFITFGPQGPHTTCVYDNPTIRTITRGPSSQTDEQCVSFGYFFPATQPRGCYGHVVTY